jgi:hypothetical protein
MPVAADRNKKTDHLTGLFELIFWEHEIMNEYLVLNKLITFQFYKLPNLQLPSCG